MKSLVYSILITLLMVTATYAASEPIGIILMKDGEAFAKRENKLVKLDVSGLVYNSDVLITKKRSVVQVMFNDESIIVMDEDTELSMEDFSFDVAKSNFFADISKGTARMITGKIVEKNTDGFNVNTPQSTIGVRGTIFTVNISKEGHTTVTLNDIGESHDVIVQNTATGEKTIMDTPGQELDVKKTGNTPVRIVEKAIIKRTKKLNNKDYFKFKDFSTVNFNDKFFR